MDIIGVVGGRSFKLLYPGIEISILQSFNEDQPGHFGAQNARAKPLKVEGFTGNTDEGGSCNVYELSMIPHCNGTHTETLEHIEKQAVFPFQCLNQPFYPGRVVTIPLTSDLELETYQGHQAGDVVVTKKNLLKAGHWYSGFIEGGAVVIRTSPNLESKKTAKWDITQPAPFFTEEALQFLGELPFKHLIVDFPSLDRTHDEGRLKNHREFFKDRSRTVSEMAYVPDSAKDGNYFISLQVPLLSLDAVPSRLVLYHAKEII
ncbi:MAG: cyclase family protein [Pseudomonadota bacterium]